MGKARNCMYFSATAMVFLFLVAVIFQSSAVFYVEGLESVEQGRSSVKGAFVLYCCTFGASLAYITAKPEVEEEREINMVEIQRPEYDVM